MPERKTGRTVGNAADKFWNDLIAKPTKKVASYSFGSSSTRKSHSKSRKRKG